MCPVALAQTNAKAHHLATPPAHLLSNSARVRVQSEGLLEAKEASKLVNSIAIPGTYNEDSGVPYVPAGSAHLQGGVTCVIIRRRLCSSRTY